VLALIAEGMNNQEIAGRLGISDSTTKTHVSNVLVKLRVADRTQAAVLVWKTRLGNSELKR
jgi:NarL family two-component system response regulator LiaR